MSKTKQSEENCKDIRDKVAAKGWTREVEAEAEEIARAREELEHL